MFAAVAADAVEARATKSTAEHKAVGERAYQVAFNATSSDADASAARDTALAAHEPFWFRKQTPKLEISSDMLFFFSESHCSSSGLDLEHKAGFSDLLARSDMSRNLAAAAGSSAQVYSTMFDDRPAVLKLHHPATIDKRNTVERQHWIQDRMREVALQVDASRRSRAILPVLA